MIEDVFENLDKYQPGLSIDCVIFGFQDNQLKVLLINTGYTENWALPGGFIPVNEDIDTAANSVLLNRTRLDNIFLRQFATFGSLKRNDDDHKKKVMNFYNVSAEKIELYTKRYITIGYYALVDINKTIPQTFRNYESIQWIDHNDIPELILDHKEILEKALETLRIELNLMPVGYNLLPEKFTISELQKLYEAILDRKLDRRNFLRKITAIGILKKLDEKKQNVAHKAPSLYSFDKDKYEEVLKNGINQGW